MIKLYKQVDDIRIHAERKCRKLMTPAAEFSPQIQHWYDRIHAYMNLLKLKEGTKKYMNKGNPRRRARKGNIKNPAGLSVEQIQDGLRCCRIRASDLRKQAKGLRKTHLRNCLIVAQEKKDKERAMAIKQKIDRKHNVRMWHTIKRTVKDPRSPQVLRVQRVEDCRVCEYRTKEEVEQVVQEECEVRFNLAHKAPIMKHTLANELGYLEDERPSLVEWLNLVLSGATSIVQFSQQHTPFTVCWNVRAFSILTGYNKRGHRPLGVKILAEMLGNCGHL